MARLTQVTLKNLKDGGFVSDGGARGAGTLVARRTTSGVFFYFRYVDSTSKRETMPLGMWTGTGGPLTLAQARHRAVNLSSRYRAGERDLRAILLAEEQDAKRERDARQRALEAERARNAATLEALLRGYVSHLQREGKKDARKVERSLELHVLKAFPKLASQPADTVTTDDLLSVVARLIDQDKRTEARKLRAYLRAAYGAGLRARQDAAGLPALRALRITTNPAQFLAPVEGGSKAGDRALSFAELRAYWRHISAMNDPTGALLRFHLLTGAQRLQQLARATVADIDKDTQTIRLQDAKGRRKSPRVHTVPLLDDARQALAEMRGGALGPYVFTVSAGEKPAAPTTLHHRVKAVCQAMDEAGELEKGRFKPSDIRRTVETRLAAAGVSLEIRAQLQSHGLGGVQTRHYDRHDYLQEKWRALETLERLLTDDAATVVPISQGRTADARTAAS